MASIGHDNDVYIASMLLAPLSNTIETVTNAFDWVYSKLPSFPYGTVTSIGTAVKILRDPTPFVIGKIKDKLSKTLIGTAVKTLRDPTPFVIGKIKDKLSENEINLTQAIMTKPGEDNTLLLKILSGMQEDILSHPVVKFTPQIVQNALGKGLDKMKRNTSKPALPNLSDAMLEKMKEKMEGLLAQRNLLEVEINKAEAEYQTLSKIQKLTAHPGHRINQKKKKDALDKIEKDVNGARKEYEKNLEAATNKVPVEKPSWGTGDKIVHEIVTTLLNQLCVERNLGNVLSLFLKELAKVITSIQDVDLTNSKSIENDFIKRMSGNINIDVNEFSKKRDESLRKNLAKLALNIAKKAGKGGPTLAHPIFAGAADPLIKKVLDSLLKVFSNELEIKLSKVLTEILEKISCFEPDSLADYNSKVFQEILKNGIDFDSVNIQFPKAPSQRLLDQDQFADFKNNITLLVPLILHALIPVLVDGLVNYTAWNLGDSAPQAMSDQENKLMRSDVNKNFTDLISAIQSGIDNIFHWMMGETSKLSHNYTELSFVKLHLLDLGMLFVRNVIPGNAAQRTVCTAVKLAGYEMKSIKIAEIIPGLAEYLGKIAKT